MTAETPAMAAPLIWINGFPGVGKLTVATEIGVCDDHAIIVSNHSLIDPVARRLGPDSRNHPQYQTHRKAERDAAFRRWVLSPQFANNAIVFTDCQSVSDLGASVAREYEAAAHAARRPFVPVYLSCSIQTNLERATSEERKTGGTTKLKTLLEEIISQSVLFRFEKGLSLTTTDMQPREVAEAILAYSRKTVGKARQGNE